MDSGLFISGDSGAVQIDSTYKNAVLLAKGSVSLPPSGIAAGTGNFESGGSAFFLVPGVLPSQSPIVCIASSVRPASAFISMTQGSDQVYVSAEAEMSGNATPIDYYIFGTLKEAVSSGIGLQVFDGNGSPVFDSNYPAMRVVSVSTKAKGDISPHTQVAPSGSYAACFNGERAKTTADGQYFRYFGDKVLTSSSGAVSVLALKSRMPSNFRTDDTWIHQQSQMLLVDVTGF